MDHSAPSSLNLPGRAGGRRLFLFLSASLNVALLAYLSLFLVPSGKQAEQPNATPPGTLPPTERTVSRKIERTADPAPPASAWARLESPDLGLYAANLRDAGCPPKTIRDILLPLIEEKFDPSSLPVSGSVNFWASFSQRQAAAAARAKQVHALEQNKESALKELVGFVWTAEGIQKAHAGDAVGPIGFLDYERAEKFLCVDDRINKLFSKESHRIDRPALTQEWRKRLSEVVTPAELEEIELRGALIAYQRLNPNLSQVGLSSAELRQLMSFRRELDQPLPSALLAGDNEPLPEPDPTREQQFLAKARTLLGDTRFIDYLKSCDASIERTLAAVEKERLPRSLALQLYDLREEARAQAHQIRQLPVRRSEKRAQLAALRQSALEQLAALPDAATEGPLFQLNQEWLQEIAHP